MKFRIDKTQKMIICKECGCNSFAVFSGDNYIAIRCMACKGVKTMVDSGEGETRIHNES